MIKDILLCLHEKASEDLRRRSTGIGKIDLGLPTDQTEWLSMFMVSLELDSTVQSYSGKMQKQSGAYRSVQLPKNYKLKFAVSSPPSGNHYADGLGLLSGVQSFFHANPVMDTARAPSLPKNVERLALEMHNLKMEDLTQIWQAAGQALRPTLIFVARYTILGEGFDRVNPVDSPQIE